MLCCCSCCWCAVETKQKGQWSRASVARACARTCSERATGGSPTTTTMLPLRLLLLLERETTLSTACREAAGGSVAVTIALSFASVGSDWSLMWLQKRRRTCQECTDSRPFHARYKFQVIGSFYAIRKRRDAWQKSGDLPRTCGELLCSL